MVTLGYNLSIDFESTIKDLKEGKNNFISDKSISFLTNVTFANMRKQINWEESC